jgi:proline-specific peptidase
MAKITEGYMPYLNNKTYYRIVGERTGKKKPLLFLHGGPGSTHNYFEVLDKAADLDGRQLIMYDQIGCGNSFIDGCPELWTKQTWVDELRALREHLELDEIHLLGQSWGGMLSIIYECDYKPEGVKSYVLSSTLPYNAIWESEQKRRVAFLPADMQEAIAEAEKTGNYSGEAYDRAIGEFMRRHCSGTFDENSPECLTRPKKSGVEPYVAGWGPNEFTPTGSLRDYDYMDKLKDFSKPCLIMNGQEDLCSPYIAKLMFDAIPNAKWELFAYSRHMCFVEETDKYIDILIKWLNEND